MQLAGQTVLQTIIGILTVVVIAFGVLLIFTLVGNVTDRTPDTELERAVVAAEEAVRANPEDPVARHKIAAAYLGQGATGAAINQAEIAIRLDPNDPTGYYILGLAQTRSGDLDAAVESLERASTTEGQLAQFYQDAYFGLALAYDELDELDKALDAMDSAVDYGPENAIMLFERAQFYERHEMWADALFDYAITLTYAPGFASAEDAFRRIAEAHPDAAAQADEWLTEWETGAGATDDSTGR